MRVQLWHSDYVGVLSFHGGRSGQNPNLENEIEDLHSAHFLS